MDCCSRTSFLSWDDSSGPYRHLCPGISGGNRCWRRSPTCPIPRTLPQWTFFYSRSQVRAGRLLAVQMRSYVPLQKMRLPPAFGAVADNANRRIPVSHKYPPGGLNLCPLWREANRLVHWTSETWWKSCEIAGSPQRWYQRCDKCIRIGND